MIPKDPYRYFRIEGRELSDALGQGVLELEKAGASREIVTRLLRHAHTLKGASHVVGLAGIGKLAHAMEEVLAPFREGGKAVPRESVDGLLKLLDSLNAKLAKLDASPGSEPPPSEPGTGAIAPGDDGMRDGEAGKEARPGTAPPAPPPRADTVRLEIGEVDALLDGLSEAATGLAAMRGEYAGLERLRRMADGLADPAGSGAAPGLRAMAEELTAGLSRFSRVAGAHLDRAERELGLAHERAGRLRLMQAASMFDFLERAARDAARSLGKEVRFETSGGGNRLDAPVLSAVQEALIHVVRNAVAHGLEGAGERIRLGKPAEGRIRIEVERQGTRIFFRCADDGRGLDLDAIRKSAAARGLLAPSAGESLGAEEAARLLLSGGISTSERVSEVSGRGIGLDVVRETAARLHGEVFLKSAPGRGLEVEIRVPYSMSVFSALAVEAAGTVALIPFDGVTQALLVAEGDLARSPEGDTVAVGTGMLPFLALEAVFRRPPDRERRARPAVAIRSGSGSAVVGVDRILGVRETVARPLPALAYAEGSVSGAGLDAQGNPQLVLDPEGLVRAARSRPGEGPSAGPRVRPPILVIDDSLTTRMLEQSILESAGYPVETAVSAEEGLAKAARKRFGLFLVDVEMPGMNGFQFVEAIRGDDALRGIPAILITSRSSPEDKRRGAAAGASDYIVKGEFDQARLLARIRELAG
ncbi:MAG TPA: response regulator [Fibrobacteria bacterium]|nr:response regulator [Fibrobacteria bacterium]